jgi:hypothetical protein
LNKFNTTFCERKKKKMPHVIINQSENHVGIVTGQIVTTSVEIIRPSGDITYGADTVISPAANGPMFEIPAVARINGGSGYIVDLAISTNKKLIIPRLRLRLFNALGASISGDNVPFMEKYADGQKRLGSIQLPAMENAADLTNTDMSRTFDPALRKYFKCDPSSTSIYGVLETLDAFQADSGQKFTLTLVIDAN